MYVLPSLSDVSFKLLDSEHILFVDPNRYIYRSKTIDPKTIIPKFVFQEIYIKVTVYSAFKSH